MRISDPRCLVGALALAGCSSGQGAEQSYTPVTAEKPGLSIDCALAGAQAFRQDCTVEQSAAGAGVTLTLRHADGGFRRLRVTQDGHGVASADGALPAQVALAGGDQIEVRVGDDRYRLPATVGAR